MHVDILGMIAIADSQYLLQFYFLQHKNIDNKATNNETFSLWEL